MTAASFHCNLWSFNLLFMEYSFDTLINYYVPRNIHEIITSHWLRSNNFCKSIEGMLGFKSYLFKIREYSISNCYQYTNTVKKIFKKADRFVSIYKLFQIQSFEHLSILFKASNRACTFPSKISRVFFFNEGTCKSSKVQPVTLHLLHLSKKND